ncbi:hypothetical protein LX36DRAFT_324277 [Colletotrichum falcatum]|nr:hypothetical protein LX36DRAFT_324277 [Colletotrichum falcatum]
MSTLPARARKKLTHDAYRIGWICPLQIELQAALAMLDEVHETLPQPCTDPTAYKLGSINGHNIVIASLRQPGNYPAAIAATHMQLTFHNLEFGLLVGIGGGVPTRSETGVIRLGHVVVSKPTGIHSGAVNYSHGKMKNGVFERTGYIDSPPVALLQAALSLDTELEASEDCPISRNIERVLAKRKLRSKHRHPGVSKDHMRGPQDKETDEIIVHRGTVASGELVLRDAALRDKVAEEHGVLCFEMEAAGALTNFRCLVIRGISNYCDELKNDDWNGFASAAAAAYARELFFHLPVMMEEIVRPRHFVVPFTQNRDFVGRGIFLEELRAKLCADDGPRRLAVTGLGGIGKTQVALQTAFWFRENRPTWSVFWVAAYSMNAFEKACSVIVNSVGILVAKDEGPREAVRRFLNSRDAGNWLLIVDNADDGRTVFRSGDSPGIHNYLPANEDGRILFTSRFRKLASELAGKQVFELGKMSTPEARKFFEQAVLEEASPPGELVEELLDQLEHLPLAISQAAAYLSNNSISTSTEDYLSILRGTEKEAAGLLSREYQDYTRYDDEDIGHAVATTWLVSFRHLEQMNDSGAAIDLLKFISQIEPTSIPLDLLPRRTLEDLRYAIGVLAGFAFLDRRAGTDLLYMHRLVHLASRIWFEKKGLAGDNRQFALSHITETFPSNEWREREVWRAYMPHALKLLEPSADRIWWLDEARLAEAASECLMRDHRFRESIRLLEDALTACRRPSQPDATTLLGIQGNLAWAYSGGGQFKKAKELVDRIVKVPVESRPRDDLWQRVHQCWLACTCYLDGQVKQAIELLEETIGKEDASLPRSDPLWMEPRRILAHVYIGEGRAEKAIEILKHASEVARNAYAESDPRLLLLLQELATSYLRSGETEKAVKMLEHVVTVYVETGDGNGSFLFMFRNELVAAYLHDNQLEKAAELLGTLVSTEEWKHMEDDQHRLSAHLNLAKFHRIAGRQAEAAELLKHVVSACQGTQVEDNHLLPASQLLLGEVCFEDGRHEEAVERVGHAVRLQNDSLGGVGRDCLLWQHTIDVLYKATGRIASARALARMVQSVSTTRHDLLLKADT